MSDCEVPNEIFTMHYLIFDFETTGIGKDKENNYKSYDSTKCPLPRENYPVELSDIACWMTT